MPIALIPARTGSVGIPYKNYKALVGPTPLERAVTCCTGAGYCPHVSGDALDTRHTTWPFWIERPAALCISQTPMRAVVEHFFATVDGPPYEIVLLVQPTQPLREPKHLRAAVALMEAGAHSVVSLTLSTPYEKSYKVIGDRIAPLGVSVERRQDCTPTYTPDGTVYAFRRATFLADPRFITPQTAPLIIPPEETASLDTPLDWQLAELRLKAQSHDQAQIR